MTLLEIMIVVALIGLLATLAGPRIWAEFRQGERRVALAKCKEYHGAVLVWRTTFHRWPSAIEDLESPLAPGEDDYVRLVPDPWGGAYWLEREAAKVRICSAGPDGQQGTDDDICYVPRDE